MTTQTKPIELYYWPTPNGWKITIMLEELGVPYEVKFINIGKGEQFEPSFLKIAPNNRMPAIIDPEGPDGQPISIFESGAILQYLGRKFGQFYPADERREGRGRAMAVLAGRRPRPDGRAGAPLPAVCARKDPLCGRPLHQRGQPALRRHEQAPGRPRFPRRRLFDRRHGRHRLGQALQEPGPGDRGLPESEALVRSDDGAAGGRSGHWKSGRSTAATSPTTRKRRRCCSASARAAEAPDSSCSEIPAALCAAGLSCRGAVRSVRASTRSATCRQIAGHAALHLQRVAGELA